MALPLEKTCSLIEEDIDYSVDTVYLFTWNPKSNNCNHKQKWLEMITKLKHFNRCMKKYCIVPEISDIGRLHCHGWFVLKDKVKWLKSVKPTIEHSGFMKINKLKHANGLKYYKKEIKDTCEVIPEYWPLSHSNLQNVLKSINRELLMIDKEPSHSKFKAITSFFNIN